MDYARLHEQGQTALRGMLGYLNLSSGAADVPFRRQVNELYGLFAAGPAEEPPWRVLRKRLAAELEGLSSGSAAFADSSQARAVIELTFDRVLPAYRDFHCDLLAQQSDDDLFGPFFVARVCETVLSQQGPWDQAPRIVAGTIARLNDFIGYRPVAVLRTAQKIEPYPHEWVAPLPLFFRGAGVAVGKYQELVAAALAILERTEPSILEQACFDPALLDELALDPRAYDFDHPVNKRPNYHFGQWDPHTIDNAGRYRRFILEEVTLAALCERVDQGAGDRAELMAEAAAVLAGTMLMAAGVSGSGPDTHDSTTTLATLLPRIAAYRDAFYAHFLATLPGAHGERLRAEAAALKQPCGAARQDLNQRLARLRATQLQHVHLARLFATMGNLAASSRQAQVVPVTSARLLSEISGRITIGHLAIDRGQAAEAARRLVEIEDLLRRAIQCGAVVDPWNILGFQGQFSLFPAMENSVRDHRVDVLVHLMRQIFALYVRLAGEAAATGQGDVLAATTAALARLANWWDRFGTLTVSGIDSVSGREATESTAAIAGALAAWHEAGATGGDVAFWREHVGQFRTAKSYSQVVQVLLSKADFKASLGLLVQWLSQCDAAPLGDAECDFDDLATRWLHELHAPAEPPRAPQFSASERWALTAKFFDYLEANAAEYWDVPQFAFGEPGEPDPRRSSDNPDDDDEPGDLFQAAYEGVTYLDSTADGHEGETLESGEPASDFQLDLELDRLRQRLGFLRTLARLWGTAAVAWTADHEAQPPGESLAASLAAALSRAGENRQALALLLRAVHRQAVPKPSGSPTSLVEYDRRRRVKEALLAEVVQCSVEMADAERLLAAAAFDASRPPQRGAAADWEAAALPLVAAMLRGDAEQVRRLFPALRGELARLPILYVPLSRGGDPEELVAAQARKQLLLELLTGLPRLGLLAESCRLIATMLEMERNRPRGEKVVTEFDRLFEVGYQALVAAVLESAASWQTPPAAGDADAALIDCLQLLSEPLLTRWLEHSRTVRLSALERVADPERWDAVVGFIGRYGGELFTQRFMNLGNLRAILDQGVDAYLQTLRDQGDAERTSPLLDDLEANAPRAKIAEPLQIILEAVVENYAEYKDFNTTTTQSDRGELLYTLLDFLRLKASYDRVCWNIRPIVLAHPLLMHSGRMAAAELWRRTLADRTSDVADWHLARLRELEQRHRMRLSTVADRLAERFVRPLAVDALRALVTPAMEEVRQGKPGAAFAVLEQEIGEFAEQPSGAGLETPAWLTALEQEAALARRSEAAAALHDRTSSIAARRPPVRLTLAAVQEQLRACEGASGDASSGAAPA